MLKLRPIPYATDNQVFVAIQHSTLPHPSSSPFFRVTWREWNYQPPPKLCISPLFSAFPECREYKNKDRLFLLFRQSRERVSSSSFETFTFPLILIIPRSVAITPTYRDQSTGFLNLRPRLSALSVA